MKEQTCDRCGETNSTVRDVGECLLCKECIHELN